MSLAVAMLSGCGKKEKKKDDTAAQMARLEHSEIVVEVEVMELREAPFRQQLATNGRLRAREKSILAFRTGGIIERVHVVNGQRVAAGAVLAELDRTDARSSLTSAQMSFEQAKVNLNDRIIGLGYESLYDPEIPERAMELARMQTNYNQAELTLQNAQRAYNDCTLRAPFTGKVADIKGNRHERSGGEFCTLVDDSRLIVEFSVLETELDFVRVGNTVRVTSFFDSDNAVVGRIVSVNPLVNRNGQVSVEAEIANNGTFIDGMNVKLLAEMEVPDKMVVPKGAVVMRDNLEVLFVYRDGRAYWTYVHTRGSNSEEYVVVPNTDRGAELSPGDMVIVAGNMNLANGTNVVATVRPRQ